MSFTGLGPTLPEEIRSIVKQLGVIQPTPSEIWLFGSRANNRATKTSDWDLLVFASPQYLSAPEQALTLTQAAVDILVVRDGNIFKAIGNDKSGSLKEWKWNKKSTDCASYEGTKWEPDTESSLDISATLGNVIRRNEGAICIWRNP